ncbi:DUF11 domain-containing protein [Cellulomonas composti]|uniref:DUF11 domain-containing protein n=1 Tax=Cellulomonas composti TaxID=266130 RepID=A0A511J816_9CELL|nr:DUF11 domain-containing protein [Cellulomonas composti]GEL94114.1 hypothetical protein CCO02nite_07720 [Cellulomonas composti]
MRAHPSPRQHVARRWVASIAVWALALGIGTVATVAAAVATAPAAGAAVGTLTLGHDGTSASVLAGEDATITFVAGNAGAAADIAYNVTFVATLPPGVTYVPGSTTPAAPAAGAPGDPQEHRVTPDPLDPSTWYWVLVWSNVTDLPAGAATTIGFEVDPDEALFPVGSTIDVATGVYGSADERKVPKVVITPGGAVVTGDDARATDAPSVLVAPVELTKSEPSTESELLRGLDDHVTTYTLQVRTAEAAGTAAVVVTDLVPAQLHFLGCVSVDLPADCATLVSQTTGTDDEGRPVTVVVWDLGDVPAGTTVEIRYHAAAGTDELAADGTFTGSSTRQDPDGVAATNRASLTGTYQGEVDDDATTAVTVETEHTVRVMDVALHKSTSATDFVVGGTATFTLEVRVSQYVDASGLTVTDTLPDGTCPFVEPGTTLLGTWPADCSALETRDTAGATMTSATANADGTFTLLLTLDDVAANGTATVTYDTYLRAQHADGSPTSTGDEFGNEAQVDGLTSPAAGSPESGDLAVTDDSSAGVGTQAPSLVKKVWPNTTRQPISGYGSCPAYTSAEWTTTGTPVVRLGDLVCFQVTVTAAPGVALRDALVRDFVPTGMTFVDGGIVHQSPAFDVEQVPGDSAWVLGDEIGDARFMPAGATVTAQLVAQVTSVDPSDLDVLGNLAKLRSSDAQGRVSSQRAEVEFGVLPAAPVTLAKTVTTDTGTSANQQTREGEVVTYHLTATHAGDVADQTDYPIDSVELWDALPVGFTCADVVDPALTCVTLTDGPAAGRDAVQVTLDGADLGADALLTVGESVLFDLQVRVPSPLSIGSVHVNDASVVAYTSPTTDGRPGAEPVTYVPANSLADPDEPNAPAANAQARVFLPGAAVTKTLTSTSITESNNASGDATVGELATFRYAATVRPGTSVFAGRLVDTLPANGRFVITGVAVGPMPAGVTVSTVVGCTPSGTTFCLSTTTGELRFPATWTNATAADQVFAVDLTVRIADVSQNTHASTPLNTATLWSRDTAAATTDVNRGFADAPVRVVLPTAAVVKTPLNGSGSPVDPLTVGAGDTVTYRVTITNSANRPPLHDAVVVDCVPPGLTVVASSLPAEATLGTSAGTPTCPAGRTTITWAAGSVTATTSAGTRVLTYQATVDPTAGSGVGYTNRADLTGSTLNNGGNGIANERSLTANDSATVSVVRPAGSKLADRETAVPGDVITWTVNATIPANANFYDLALLDTVPAGLDPAVGTATLTCTGATGWQAVCDAATFDTQGTGPTKVAWLFGDVAASTSVRYVTLTYTSTVAPAGVLDAGESATNSASLGWFTTAASRTVGAATTFESTNALGTDTVVIHEPVVTVGKSVSDSTVEPGQVVTYTVTAQAGSTSPRDVTAYVVVVVDTVPAGVVPLTAGGVPAVDGDLVGGGTWDATARTITWSVASIAPGATATRTYPARLADSDDLDGTALTNSVVADEWASLATGGREYGPSAAATATITPQLPLVNTAKTQVTANPVYVGDEVAYRITLTNAGAGTARTVDVRDVLPASWTFVAGSATYQVGAGAQQPLANPTAVGQTLTWTTVGGAALNLAPGQQLVIRYAATPLPAAATSAGSAVAHTNTAQAARVTDPAGGDSYDGGDGSYIGTSGSATARIHTADLEVRKVHSTWVAGTSTNTWTVTVTNHGPDPAVGVVVDDVLTPLPAGVEVVSVAGTGWSCSSPSGDLSTDARCTYGSTLAVDATATFVVAVAIDADVPSGTTATNDVTVDARTYDDDPANDEATSTATVTTVADLELVKTGPTSVAAGGSITWTVTVTNRGPSVSRGTVGAPIVVADTLPAGVTVSTVTPTGATCDEITGTALTCRRTTDLAVNGSFSVQVTGTVDDTLVAADGPLVNQATVTPVTPQGANTYPDTDSTSTAVTHAEDLTIDKDIVGELRAGETGTYSITVANGGPSVARGVVVTDELPDGLTFAGYVVSDDDWTCTGTTDVTCELGTDLAVGAAAATTFTFDVDIDPGVTQDIVNTAVVGSDWQDDQDDDTVTTGPTVIADLGITKVHDGDELVAGTGTTFTIVVTNHGPADAPGPITMADTVPSGLPVSGTVTADAGTCTAVAQVVTCTLAGGLDVGDDWTIEVPVAVADDALPATYTNTARVAGPPTLDEGDDDWPNTADDVVEVVRAADLSITKDADPTTVVAGDPDGVTYALVVENAGPSVAAATVVTDTLPSGLEPVSATWAGHDDACAIVGQTVTCTIGDLLPSADPVEITVVARVRSGVADGTTIVNTAYVASTTPDVDGEGPTGDSDDATITVDTAATLTIAKTPDVQTVRAGDPASFDLVVTNEGPSDVLGPVTITDTLPTGLSYDSSSTAGSPLWACDAVDQEVTCTLGDGTATLVAGADAPTLTITTIVDAAADAGTYTNTAYASSPLTGDSDPDTADVDVVTFADLGVTKSHAGVAVAGEPFTWTLTVTNGGPSDSRATADDPIVVVDTLPAGVTFAPGDDGTVTGGGFTCAAGDPVVVGGLTQETVRCERPTTLVDGAAVQVDLPVLLDADLLGTVTNTATVTPGVTPQPDDEVLADTGTDDVSVTGLADLGVVKTVTTPVDEVVAGGTITWDVQLTNHGPSTSRADADTPIVVADTLPAGVHGATATGDGWVCTTDADRITCERDEDLLVGPAPAITVTATVDSGATTELRNVVDVFPGLTPQPDGASGEGAGDEPDQDDAAVTPGTLADLAIAKTVVDEPLAGGTGTYRLRVTNLGPSDAMDVVVTDDLPAGLTFREVAASSTGSTWDCTGDVECALDGPLVAATVVWVEIVVDVAPGLTGDVENTAVVTSSTPDPDEDNNTDTVTSGSDALADLAVVKSHRGTARVGGSLTFDLVVSNAGPSVARDVTLSDVVPASLQVTGVRADGQGWTCATGAPDDSGTPVLCLRDELAAGATAPAVHVDVLVTAAAYPSVVNVVDAASSTPSPDEPGGATATDDDTVDVPALVDLAITKVLDGERLRVGQHGTYVLTITNAGPAPDPGPITVTDDLPAGLTFVSASTAASDEACAADGRLVTCTLDGLGVGEQVEVRLVVAVGEAATPSVTNVASVTSPAEDTDPSNDTDQVTVPVDEDPLATTGATVAGLLALALALVLAGGGVLLLRRRTTRAAA